MSGGFPFGASFHITLPGLEDDRLPTLCPKSLKGKGSSPFANQFLKAVGS